MFDPRISPPIPGKTFWLILGCGILCGGAFAVRGLDRSAPAVAAPERAAPDAAAPSANGSADPTALLPRALRPAEPSVARRDTPPDPARSLTDLLALAAFLVAGGALFVHLQGKKGAPTGVRRDKPLEHVASIRVGGKWPLALVRIPGRMLVVGGSDKGLRLLAEVPDDPWAVHADATPAREADDMHGLEPLDPPWPADLPETASASDDPAPLEPYRRPTRRTSSATTPPQGSTSPRTRRDDAFLDHLMDRLQEARPAAVREAAPDHERDLVRQRIYQLRRGPTQL